MEQYMIYTADTPTLWNKAILRKLDRILSHAAYLLLAATAFLRLLSPDGASAIPFYAGLLGLLLLLRLLSEHQEAAGTSESGLTLSDVPLRYVALTIAFLQLLQQLTLGNPLMLVYFSLCTAVLAALLGQSMLYAVIWYSNKYYLV